MRTLSPEQRCEAAGDRQHGVFHRAQVLAFGVTRRMIDGRLSSGRWVRVLPGVYCLKGTRLTWHGMLMAACLWAEGVVSHRSASLLWGLEGVNDRLIEITTTTRRESVPGVLVHRVGAEEDLRIMRYQGLCVTDPTRTLINLAGVVDDITLQAALDSALRQRRTYPRLLLRCLDETSTQGRKGASLLRALVVERATGGRPTDSPLEIEAEKFLSRNGIHPAERQHWVSNSRGERRRLDFAWPELKIGIEVDSRRWHEGFSAMEADVARSNFYVDAGWQVLRLTRRGMRREGASLIARLRRLRGQAELELGLRPSDLNNPQ